MPTPKQIVTDLTSRDAVEEETARVIAKILTDYESRIIITDPSIPPAQLDRLENEIASVLFFALMTVYRNEATQLGLQLDLSNPNIDKEAQDWAFQKVRDTIKQFRQDSLKIIQKAKAKKDADNAAVLALVLSPQRAINLSSTYVTQAANQAEINQHRIFTQNQTSNVQINQDGTIKPPTKPLKAFEMIWNTREDERVCPICQPLNDTPHTVWMTQFPLGPGTAHPNCRCYLTKNYV